VHGHGSVHGRRPDIAVVSLYPRAQRWVHVTQPLRHPRISSLLMLRLPSATSDAAAVTCVITRTYISDQQTSSAQIYELKYGARDRTHYDYGRSWRTDVNSNLSVVRPYLGTNRDVCVLHGSHEPWALPCTALGKQHCVPASKKVGGYITFGSCWSQEASECSNRDTVTTGALTENAEAQGVMN
jgi:hypothetical protein